MLLLENMCMYLLIAWCTFFGNPKFNSATGDVGGHSLFTSLAQLEILWYDEIRVVRLMERLSKKLNITQNPLKM